MKKIKELAPKPSDCLQAMVDGLLNFSQRKNCEVNMGSFGRTDGKICFACAATCAVQQLAGVWFTHEDKIDGAVERAKILQFNATELYRFEQAVDCVRLGRIVYLFKFCEMKCPNEFIIIPLSLSTNNWREQLPLVRDFIAQLQQAGY